MRILLRAILSVTGFFQISSAYTERDVADAIWRTRGRKGRGRKATRKLQFSRLQRSILDVDSLQTFMATCVIMYFSIYTPFSGCYMMFYLLLCCFLWFISFYAVLAKYLCPRWVFLPCETLRVFVNMGYLIISSIFAAQAFNVSRIYFYFDLYFVRQNCKNQIETLGFEKEIKRNIF